MGVRERLGLSQSPGQVPHVPVLARRVGRLHPYRRRFRRRGSPALGAFPGQNGKIAFDSDRGAGNDTDIWTMNPDGSNLANLTANSDGFELLSPWRPDGRKLLFMSDRARATNPEGDFELFVMNANGSNQTQITFNALDDE